MANKSTFIKIDRNILNWRWYKNGNTMRVFIHLLLNANIKDCDFETYTIKRGQFATSFNSLSKKTGISIRSVRTALNHLKSTDEVTIETSPKFSIITIKNYDKYQCLTNTLTTDRQTTDKQPTIDRQQSKKVKNIKNVKNEKNNIYTSASADRRAPFDYQAVINSFNSVCTSLPKVQKLTDSRRKSIRRASENLGDMSFEELFERVEGSDFLTGRSGDWSGCCFDWILKPDRLIKIIEGNYDNKAAKLESIRQRDYEEEF